MAKWTAIIFLITITACNNKADQAISKSNELKADSLFTLASTMITRNQNDLKDDPKALQLLNEAIGLNPEKIDFYINRGAAKMNLLMYEEAKQDFESVLTKDPEHFNALVNLAMCYNHLKQYQKAIPFSTKAITLNDQMGYAYYVRSDSYLYLNDMDNLCKDLEAAMTRNYQPAIQRMSLYCNKNLKQFKF